jgi:hypothetical protein
MRRHLFTLSAVLSLLLFVAVCLVWVATASFGFRLDWGRVDTDGPAPPSRTRYQLRVIGGQVEFARRSTAVAPTAAAAADVEAYRRSFAAEDVRLRREREQDVTRPVTGFARWAYPTYPGHPVLRGAETVWAVHDWVLAAAAAVLPAVWLLRRATRAAPGVPAHVSDAPAGHEGDA